MRVCPATVLVIVLAGLECSLAADETPYVPSASVRSFQRYGQPTSSILLWFCSTTATLH
jgi:hypothetical protein